MHHKLQFPKLSGTDPYLMETELWVEDVIEITKIGKLVLRDFMANI